MEDEGKMLKMLIKMQADDLRDSETLAGYAEKAKATGHDTLAQKFASRAKIRLGNYTEDEKEVKGVMEQMRGSGTDAPNSVQAQCLDLMLEAQKDHYYKTKSRLDSM